MSRSIHANRSLAQWLRNGGCDWDAVHHKRSVKAGMRRQRGMPEEQLPVTEAVHVPIRLVDPSPLWFYPVSPNDVRAVLERLPRGVTTGLREICIESGRVWINGIVKPSYFDRIDPLGRVAHVEMQGILAPAILGVYQSTRHIIRLFAYVRLSRKALTLRQQIDLELHALSTLVHELSHHHDDTHRMGGHRSRSNFEAHAEEYAERQEVRWVLEAVIPYLQRKYGEEHGARLRKRTLQPPGRMRERWPSSAARKRQIRAALASFPSRKSRRWLSFSRTATARERINRALRRDDLPFGDRRGRRPPR